MKSRALMVALVAVLALGVAMIASPSISQADPITITSITVSVGGQTWCNVGGSCAADHQLWNLGPGGTTLNAGESLILTQTTPTTPGYNFDTSDANSPGCGSPNPCATSLAINGTAVTLDGSGKDVLVNGNADPGTTTHNEATNWTSASSTLVGGFGSVYFGYADNLHTDACADASDNNCLPNSGSTGPANLWSNNATKFIGGGTSGVGFGVAQGGANHCSTSVASTDCFDAGAILIYNTQTAVPEPSTVLLVATMVTGLAAWSVRRNRKAISLAA